MSDETQEVAKIAPAFDKIVIAYEQNPLLAKQQFRQFLSLKPSPKWIVDGYGKKYKTFRIGDLQQLLDMVYFCQWSTKNFTHVVIGNEICGTIELHLTDPFSGIHREIVGTAAVAIQVDAGADGLNMQNKKAKALEMGFPKLATMCFKNAARQIGTLFGRDINRDVVLETVDVVSVQDEIIDELINENEQN